MMDMLYELFTEISPMYLYVSTIFSIVYAFKTIDWNINLWREHNELYLKDLHTKQAGSQPLEMTISSILETKIWLIHKMRRIDAPDDDAEIHTFSEMFKHLTTRGGQQWKNLYSLSLKNINISF